MRFLLDEQLAPVVADSFGVLIRREGDSVQHISALGESGMDDGDIPQLCRKNGISCLISANVRDFGARKFYFQTLLAEGIHVVVLRPGKATFRPNMQVSLLAQHYPSIAGHLRSASEPVLLVCTPSGVRSRSLEDLVEEFDNGKRLP